MPRYVAILEDNIARIAEMRACLTELLPSCRAMIFDEAPQMLAWLRDHISDVALISLDHDLPTTYGRDGKANNCGTGQDISDYLATMPPSCPVIIHSANYQCAIGMSRALRRAGWQRVRVTPHDADEKWIVTDWAATIRKYLDANLIAH